jgi:hypothetical protein
MVAGMFEAMMKSDVTLTLTPRGEVKDAKIPDDVMTVFKNHPQSAQLGALLTPVAIQKMMMQDVVVLPEKELAAGETWNTQSEIAIPSAGTQTEATTYKFEGTKEIEGTTNAVISAERKMGFEKADTQVGDVNIKDQSFSSETLFDVDAGHLSSMTLQQSVTTVTTSNGQAVEQKIDQSAKVTVKPASESPSDATESQP